MLWYRICLLKVKKRLISLYTLNDASHRNIHTLKGKPSFIIYIDLLKSVIK